MSKDDYSKFRIEAVNRYQRQAFGNDGMIYTIASMFDRRGERTDDPDEALTAVVKLGKDEWLDIDLRDYGGETRH